MKPSRIALRVLVPDPGLPAPVGLRRTRMLKVKPIAREDWREEFDRVSREYLAEGAGSRDGSST